MNNEATIALFLRHVYAGRNNITYSLEELEKIIEGCKMKKRSSQENLYKLLSGKLYGVCLRYSKDEHEAKDYMQDVFLKIFDKIDTYMDKGSFEGWAKRLTVNHILSTLRKNADSNFVEIDERHGDVDNTDDNIDDIEINKLLKLIQELPPKYRTVFNMYVIEEYSHQEIADELGISSGTSKSNLHRAKAILKNAVEEYRKYNK
ncbi:MAG: RNA polymerase sigma factor [Bacteroidales bacterium]